MRIRPTAFVSAICLLLTTSSPARATYTFSAIAEYNASSSTIFGNPTINDLGVMAWQAPTSIAQPGYYWNNGGTVSRILAATPGLGYSTPIINNSNSIAFTSNPGFAQTLTVQTLMGVVVTAVGSVPNYDGANTSNMLGFNDSGTLAYATWASSQSIVVRVTDGTATVLVNASGVGNFASAPALNAGGTLVYAGLGASGLGVYKVSPDGTSTLVSSAVSSVVALSGPDINDKGGVIWLDRNPSQGANSLLKMVDGVTSTVATVGPVFSVLGSSIGQAINNSGATAFTATLNNGTSGVFIGSNPSTDKVLTVGDSLFGSTVTRVSFVRDGLNNAGQIGLLVTLANGLTEIVRADPIGTTAGDTQFNAILPNTSSPGSFVFTNVSSGAWFDPPLTSGFTYTMTSGSLFTKILGLPYGFDRPFDVEVDGHSLGLFGPGQVVDFVALTGGGVSSFSILGIDPAVDASRADAFPVQLEFSTPTASFTMTSVAVPEPSSGLMLALGTLGTIAFAGSRRRRPARDPAPPRSGPLMYSRAAIPPWPSAGSWSRSGCASRI